jgi:hypothetical protein
MEKTGESYTAARAVLLAADDPAPGERPPLTTSDATIRERTGRGWEEWFDEAVLARARRGAQGAARALSPRIKGS